ncbi:MAG: exodeoxyribonuclease VII small subunit [Verrucomicrobiota bacterium]
MAKKGSNTDGLSFEASLDKLESIVEVMESGEMPLDEIIEQYEEGMKHLAACDKKLMEAEKKIRQLTADATGGLQETDFESAGTDDGDGAKLF